MNRKRLRYYCYIILVFTIIVLVGFAIRKIFPEKKGIYKSIKPLQGITIALDPGHGGIDSGTKHGDLLEKDINLAISLKIRDGLLKKGGTVIMTREKDHSLEGEARNGSRHSRDLKARVKIIEESQADIFISIHVNHIKNTKPLGSIVFYSLDNEKSLVLGEILQKELNNLSKYKEQGIELSRSPLNGDYYLLNHSKVPGVLIETGFISNELDRRFLLDEDHQEELTSSIINGIFTYLDFENQEE